MNPAQRLADRFLAATTSNITEPYLARLIQEAEQAEASALDYSPQAARVLKGLARSMSFGNVDPFPVDELWAYLAERDVQQPEIELLKAIGAPRPQVSRKPDFRAILAEFVSAISPKGLVLGIGDTDQDKVAKSIKPWTEAIAGLDRFPVAKRVWDREVKKVRLVTQGAGRGGEDARWLPAGILQIVVKPTALRVGTTRMFLIHELGHAVEEANNLTVTAWGPTPYGKPPFISDYAATNATEDFAETFAHLILEPARTRRETPEKSADMQTRLR